MSDTPLEDIFPTSDTPEQPVEEQPETIGQPRDEHGRFAPKGEEEADEPSESAPPAQEQEPERIPFAALKDERTKRQQLEAELRQYQDYFQQLQQQQPPQPEPDMFADPDGFKTHLAQQIRAELMQELQPQLQQQQVLSRVEMSEYVARQKWEDYDSQIEVFKQALAENPFLDSQLRQAPDPATFAYNAARQYQQAKQYGGALPSREQIEAELREKIMAEVGLNRPNVPTTLAADRSVGSRSGPAWTGPPSINDIFPR